MKKLIVGSLLGFVVAAFILTVSGYLEANLAETKRIRRVYGKYESPIYPYLWWRKHDNSRDLDADIWELTLREVLDKSTGADGAILWGGWQVTWDETAPWWLAVKSRLLDKRRLS
jgi:hypothetical protein